MTSTPSGYVLLSAIKNESSMLDGLFKSVISQTLKPMLWVVAEDGSDDDSLARAKSLAANHAWIVVTTRQSEVCHPWLKYASAIRFAMATAEEEVAARVLSPSMVGVLDGDTVVEHDYFEKLMSLAGMQRTGIVAGMIATEGGGRLETRPMPRGCARLYGMEFIREVGGFPYEAAYDTVLEIKAANRDYCVRVAAEARGIHRRKSTTITGETGLRLLGTVRYVMGMDILSAFGWTAVYVLVLGPRVAATFFAGYVRAFGSAIDRTADPETLRYFRNSWVRWFSSAETRDSLESTLFRD